MRNFLAEHSGAFDPDEVHTLVAAFDKAWEAIQASGVVYPEAKAETVRAILAKHIIAAAKNASVTMAGYATALSLLWLKRICEPQIVRRGKAASVCGLTSSRVAVR